MPENEAVTSDSPIVETVATETAVSPPYPTLMEFNTLVANIEELKATAGNSYPTLEQFKNLSANFGELKADVRRIVDLLAVGNMDSALFREILDKTQGPAA